jgi:hypothetical protein
MKKYVVSISLILFVSLLTVFLGGKHPEGAQVEPSIQNEFVPNEVLIKFK